MNKRFVLYYFIFIIGLGYILINDLRQTNKWVQSQRPLKPSKVVQNNKFQNHFQLNETPKKLNFEQTFFEFYSKSIKNKNKNNKLEYDDHFEHQDDQMKAISQNLKPDEIEFLVKTLNDLNQIQSLRSFSLDFLNYSSSNNSELIYRHLLNFIMNEKNYKNSNLSFEISLKTKAIETLTEIGSGQNLKNDLKKIAYSTQNTFIQNRANQILKFINLADQSELPSPSQQKMFNEASK